MKPEVRELCLEDLPALLGLYRQLHPSDPGLNAERAEWIWKEIEETPSLYYLGGFDKAELVASCHISILPNLTRGGRPYAVIENVVTRADRLRQGYGRAVITAALHRAAGAGCYKVMLCTSRQDPGVHSFYQSLGFRRGEKEAYVLKLD